MIDLHQHPGHFEKTVEDIIRHTDALGGRMAVLLPGSTRGAEDAAERTEVCREAASAHPEKLLWFCSPHPEDPDAAKRLEEWAKAGARGFGEHKVGLPCDDERSVKLYRLAGRLGLPVLIHFEDANYNTSFERFARVLEELPGTDFIGHAQTWWASISAADRGRSDYPKEPVQSGGLTDTWLSDYPNLYADLSAGSGLNACERDKDFYRGFIARHKEKLIFGTDCPCRDGRGGGWKQGTCFGERMLANLRKLSGEDVFQAITEGNLKRLLKLG